MLFYNEIFNIGKISNVIYYKPKHLARYKPILPTYEIMYYTEGESVISFNGKKYEMSAGTVLYLPKGIENNEYSIFINKPVKLYNIYFDTNDEMPLYPIKINVKSQEVEKIFEKIFRTFISKKDGYYYKTMQYTYRLAELLKKIQISYSDSSSILKLTECEEYISKHYCDYKFNFEELTAVSGFSYSYFKKLFIKKYGLPPVKYINQLKINRACELLESNSFSVTEIAEICGFENTYYFSNVFKNHMGVSPRNYLNNKLKASDWKFCLFLAILFIKWYNAY